MRSPTLGPVPAVVHDGQDSVVVERAWPSAPSSGTRERMIRIEGHDREGRLRAGRLDIQSPTDFAAPTVSLASYGADPRLPGLGSALAEGDLVVHRLGRRAVVRRPDCFIKVLRPSAADAVLARSRAGAAIASASGFATCSMVASGDGRLELSVLGGVALHESGGSMPLAQWRAAWDVWADGWTAVLTTGWEDRNLPAHTAADEVAGLELWLGHLHALVPLSRLQRDLDRRARALSDEFADTPADPLVVSHRDLHDKQILWDGTSIGLLDLDTFARAEPACDLANLAVHAELRTVQGRWTPEHRDVVLGTVERVAQAAHVTPRRLMAYAEATRLRLAMLYSFRPRWAPLMADWLHERSLIAVSWG